VSSRDVDESAVRSDWRADLTAMVTGRAVAWHQRTALAQVVGGFLTRTGDAVPETYLRSFLTAALAHGDAVVDRQRSHEAEIEVRARREGVRGVLWLARSLEPIGRVAEPSRADRETVTGGQRLDRTSMTQGRRWSAVRYGRVLGKHYATPSSARTVGDAHKGVFAEQLLVDVEAFLADDVAIASFVETAIPYPAQHDRFRLPARVSPSLAHALRSAAGRLNSLPPYYPRHLTVTELAEGRLVGELDPRAAILGVGAYSNPTDIGPIHPAVETLSAVRRGVLLGDPGAGKSTIARAVALSLESVAVVVLATALQRELERGDGVIDAVARVALSTGVRAPARDDVEELAGVLATDGDALLVIDGLDEVLDSEERIRLEQALASLESVPGKLLLTARLMGYWRRPGWQEYLALPLSDMFEQFVGRWYGSMESAPAALAVTAYRGSAHLREMVESPILAGLVAALAGSAAPDVLANRARLYQHAVTWICQRNWKHPHHPQRDEGAVVALLDEYEEAAWQLAVGVGEPDAEAWANMVSFAYLTRIGRDAGNLKSGELLIAYGAATMEADVDRSWIWLHRSFADYFVGKRLLKVLRGDPNMAKQLIGDGLQYPIAWHDALSFLADAATDDERELLAELIEELIREGDPGEVIEGGAVAAFEHWPEIQYRFISPTPEDSSNQPEVAPKPMDASTEAELWGAFRAATFPDIVPIAEKLGDAFLSIDDDAIDDPVRLAGWALDQTRSFRDKPLPERLLADEALLGPLIDGAGSAWAALTVGLLAPDLVAERAETCSVYAEVGRMCAEQDTYWTYSRSESTPTDSLVAPLVDEFEAADVGDIERVSSLLEELSHFEANLSVEDGGRLLSLHQRLGDMPWPYDLYPPRQMVRREADLLALLQVVVSRHVDGAKRAVAHAALAMRRRGIPPRLASMPFPSHLDARQEEHQSPILEYVAWAAETGPKELDLYVALLEDAGEQLIAQAFDRVGDRFDRDSFFLFLTAQALSRTGALPRWRPRLLETGATTTGVPGV
jgi:hypothetical protein